MIRLLFAFLLAVALFAVLRISMRHQKITVRQFFYIYCGVLVGALLVFFGLTGRLHWLFVLLGAALPFLGRIVPMLLRVLPVLGILKHLRGGGGIPGGPFGGGAATPRSGQTSEMRTTWVAMVLYHDSGEMDGEVLLGTHAGALLSTLSVEQAITVLREAAGDQDSAQVLRAYLDRQHPDWAAQAGADEGLNDGLHDGVNNGGGSDMNRSQAFDILGLDDDASEQEIVQAHKRLMQKVHPDRGGSTYLAAKINQAKDYLLGR